KQIWPALHAMAKRGALTVPVVGVAYSKWDREKALDYARAAVKDSGASIDDAAWKNIEHDFQYVDGDYRDTKTFEALAQALGEAGGSRGASQTRRVPIRAVLTRGPPVGPGTDASGDEKAKALRPVRPPDRRNAGRGQFRGYHDVDGVAGDSTVETYAAVRLHI